MSMLRQLNDELQRFENFMLEIRLHNGNTTILIYEMDLNSFYNIMVKFAVMDKIMIWLNEGRRNVIWCSVILKDFYSSRIANSFNDDHNVSNTPPFTNKKAYILKCSGILYELCII